MAYYNTQAIVLASQSVGEADRILTLLTYERGRVRAIARGARRPRNRFAALAQPLNLIEVQLSGTNNLENLTQGQMVNSFRYLKDDLDRLAYAGYFLELFNKATEGASDVAEAFILLLTSLELIQYGDDLAMVRLVTEMKLLAAIGFRPQLQSCIFCQQTVDESKPLYYNVSEGGICCLRCQTEGKSKGMQMPCSATCRRLLLDLLVVEPRQVQDLHNDTDTMCQAQLILQESLRQGLGDLPKSAEFLSTVIANSMGVADTRQDEG